jgi:hypothetical protein
MIIMKGKATMARLPKRLQNLNLEVEEEENDQQDEDMQGPPKFNIRFPEEASVLNRLFKIICEFVFLIFFLIMLSMTRYISVVVRSVNSKIEMELFKRFSEVSEESNCGI